MSNTTYLQGSCIAPFLDASRFPDSGGYIGGRFCAPIAELPGDPLCCLPCPATDWAYPDSFETYNTIAEWLNVAGLILMAFMLVSYAVLPAQKTRSHYLSVCLIFAVMMIAIGFIIPLGADPKQCFNEITPNDMYSSNECAWSGAFIIAGGLCATLWIFIRAFSMHLQICWDIVPGRRFFYGAQAFGWGVPAVLFTATLTATGVSFRFGEACHVNHENSMADFWGPLLGFAAASVLLQLATFGYCIHVYLRNLWADAPASSTNASGSNLPSYNSSVRTQAKARAVYQRIKKVLWLQWRGIVIVTIILTDVVFFSVVFVYLDDLQAAAVKDISKVMPWLLCLAESGGDKTKCFTQASHWLVNESTVAAVLILLSLTGIQVFIFLSRPSMFSGWVEYLRNRFSSRQEFVSLDALPSKPSVNRSGSKQELLRVKTAGTAFEMQRPKDIGLDLDMKTLSPTSTSIDSPEDVYRSPLQFGRETPESGRVSPQSFARGTRPPEYIGRVTPETSSATPPAAAYNRQAPDYFNRPASSGQRRYQSASPDIVGRRYQSPTESFSQPIAPNRQSSLRSMRSLNWDPKEMYARGGLALNPPSEASESREDVSVYSQKR